MNDLQTCEPVGDFKIDEADNLGKRNKKQKKQS